MKTENTENNIQLILRQTNYTEDQAKIKLTEFNNEPLLVIKDFLGIPAKKTTQITSVNQEIYRQLRYKLDNSMREYKSKTEK